MYNEENEVPSNLKFCYLKTFKEVKSTKIAKGIAKKGRFWSKNSFVSIFFMGGTTRQISSMKETIESILEPLELTAVYPQKRELSDIRISFNYGQGSYSYVGTDCKFVPKDQETLNLGWWGKGTERHEFCHALNLSHEHQNPKGGIVWNKNEVLRTMSAEPNNWDARTIEDNILKPLSLDSHIATRFDKDSIMLYPFPTEWTVGDFESSGNEDLSKGDKAFLKRHYVSTKRDVKSPVITLYGGVVVLNLGEIYKEPGFKAVDNIDGDITDKVEYSYDIVSSKLGVHSIVYKVKDNAGNSTTVVRNILIRKKPSRTPQDSTTNKQERGCAIASLCFSLITILIIVFILL